MYVWVMMGLAVMGTGLLVWFTEALVEFIIEEWPRRDR